MARFSSLTLAAAIAAFMSNFGCSAASGGGPNTDAVNGVGSGGQGNASGMGGSGSGSFGAGSGPSGTGGAGFVGVIGSGGSIDLQDGGCFSTSSAAEQVVTTKEVTVTTYSPVDIYIMYDQSGSMDGDTPVGTKWDAIEAALTGFVNDPTSSGISVGIGYFPFVNPAAPPLCFVDADCGSFGPCVPVLLVGYCQGADACLPSQYVTPDVPIEPLPAVAPKIVGSLNAHRPAGGTPTAGALAGALDYAVPWAAAHPDRKTIVVLATDGNPSGCNGNGVQDVANIAASGLAATPPVQTFVIGVGDSLTSLNAIAAAGGTGQALIVDTASGDPTQQFLDAMNAIRDQITTTMMTTETQTTPVPCEWEIPAAPGGETFDKNLVNVDVRAGSGAPQRIGAVPSAADCALASGGWHYDNPDAPAKVLVCPNTCQTIQGMSDARVDVVFGCATEPAIIK